MKIRNETLVHEAICHNRTTIFDYLVVQKHCNLNFVDGYETPLHYAAWEDNFEFVRVLVEHGANINQCDEDGNTALMRATSENVWKYLLEQGSNINKKNSDGSTPLHLAILNNYYEALKYLIKKGADVNEKDNEGKTALHTAVSLHHYWYQMGTDPFKMCTYLVEHNADVNLENKKGETPLHCAILLHFYQACKYFIEHGADVNRDVFGTAMHVAATSNHVELIAYLIEERHVDVNAIRKRDNWTPLHCAAFSGNLNALKYLIEHGANTQAKDKYGKTPAQMASDKTVIAYMNASVTKPRARRSVGTTSMSFPVPYYSHYVRKMITCGGKQFWNLDHFSSRSLHASWARSFASQLQNFFFLFHLILRNLGPLADLRVTSGPMHMLQNRFDSVAENAIDTLPDFENERIF
jgi:ankyrin repeat protein